MVDYTDYPELIDVVRSTVYAFNPEFEPGESNPWNRPVRYAWPRDAAQALRLFKEAVSNITDDEYGDFKRRANSYICTLKEHLKFFGIDQTEKLAEMQNYTQFLPSGDITDVRKRLLFNADQILNSLASGSITNIADAGSKEEYDWAYAG